MKYLLSFLTIGLLLTIAVPVSFAQESPMSEAPETLEEAKTIGERILKDLPEALKKPWQEALAIWDRMLGWFKNIISVWFREIWYNINSFLGEEVERRKPEIEEEFEKEKQEMREEIPKVGKSLWQRLKELIK